MLIRFILVLIILYLLYKFAKGVIYIRKSKRERFSERTTHLKGEDLVEDPFCHTHVPISEAFKASIEERAVYFCSRECYEKFKKESEVEATRS